MSLRLVLPFVGSVVGAAASAAVAATLPPLRPAELSARIAQRGAIAVVRELDAANRFDAILDRIGRGDAAWVALAPRLVPGVDGADAEGLGIALAAALPIDPAGVLAVVAPGDGVIGLRRVCGVPFIETTRAGNAAYRRRTLAAVGRISDPALSDRRDRCRAALAAP